MSLSICTYGNPILRKKAEKVMVVNDEIRALVDEMFVTMHTEYGLGLAAEQVGRSEAICIVHIPEENDVDMEGNRENPLVEMPLILINPEITGHTDMVQNSSEGCLSFPDIFANVERWYEIDVSYTDRDGIAQSIHAKGLLARAIQHEVDHLNGVLLVDRMSPVKKVALSGKLKRLMKKTQQSGQ